jgi:PPP family 3-phenylpropionic acid transporter
VRPIKAQYFVAFAVMGSVLPYLPVFLAERGLSDPQIGWVLAAAGVAVLLTPVLVTLLADTHLQNRTLLAVSFAAAAASLAWLWRAEGFWSLFAAHALFALAFAAVMPVQDGLHFASQRLAEAAGRPILPYHRVRVYGTVGFIVPSLVLYAWLAAGADVGVAIVAAIVCSGLGMINAPLLPATRIDAGPAEAVQSRPLPTIEAARAMLHGPVLVFCIASWLVHLAISAYYTFYPIYLTRLLGVDPRWIGLISNLGVLVEVFFMLAFGWLVARLGMRGLLVVGAACMTLRFMLLALFPNVWVAVGTQALHGIMVLVVHVAPPVYLNRQAGERYRNSIQGLFAMLVYGTGRIVGNAVAGHLAEVSLIVVFAYSAVLCAVVTALFAMAFRDGERTSGTLWR